MTCPECGRPLARYDEQRVSCKAGHVWTLPEHADQPQPAAGALQAAGPHVFARPRRRVPAWLPGAVLGAVAVALAVVDLLT